MFRLTSLVSGCTVALMATAVFAQAPPGAPDRAAAPATNVPDRDGDGFYRASEILGMTVRDSGGQDLGQVQDLLIEQRSQRIRYFILGQGDAANAQGSVTVVPWMAARPMFEGDQRFVTVQVEQQKLQQAPALTWQEIQAGPAEWSTRVDQFYGVSGRRGPRGDVQRDGEGRPGLRGDRPRGDRPRGERPQGDRPRGDINVERERDGDIEVEGRQPRGDRAPNVDIERDAPNAPDGEVEIEGRVNPESGNVEARIDE